MTKKKAVKKTVRKRPAVKEDVLSMTVYDKPVLRVLPGYAEANDLQKLRICSALSQWVGKETLGIFEHTQKALAEATAQK